MHGWGSKGSPVQVRPTRLVVEIEGWVDPELPAKDADAMGRLVADQLSRQLPEAGSFTWTTRAAPAC
jgi:hypothetical protein